MAKPSNDLPSAAEKGQLISKLAQRGVTGVTLARIANLSRKEISNLIKRQVLELKGVTSDRGDL